MPDPEIAGLTADSRKVAPGFLFAALSGSKADGASFIPDAITRGAVAILAPEGISIPTAGIALVTATEPRRLFARMASRFYGIQPAIMTAVTGTNGKTSTASFLRQIWTHLGHRAASLGTLGITAPGWQDKGGLTTPDTVALHDALARLASQGVTHACMEASSHGLDQHRLDGVALQAGGFTNLTRDHLDYHHDMAAYGAAKLRLFRDLLPQGGCAVVNADSDFAGAVIDASTRRGLKVLTFGRTGSELRLVRTRPSPAGQDLDLQVLGRDVTIPLPLAGDFQAANVLCALGLAIACGADADQAIRACAYLEGVPGRLEKVAQKTNGAAIFVDYAHTPDALETVLKALRPHAINNLAVVFGCGGDRDPGKRPQMGHIAATFADKVVVTDDNPRTENPDAIRTQILAACPGAEEIDDRATAIHHAIDGLDAGDVLVIAGKGHETGQIVGSTIHPFDDGDIARRAVADNGENRA
jgi:UDP-N-acetylmuramoyl-L-alanyl-D-glutamate--2,6-diaminopimelate ligase